MTKSAATRRSGIVRCAIYTRKSSEEGLEQEFNSLRAQREACEAFIASQRHEGWVCLRAGYDDGGFSGAPMDRPALQRVLADITAGRIDTIAVYKIDRLTRSLADFAKRKGMWMGGIPPLGYRTQDGKLAVIESEAQVVRAIFRCHAELGSVRLLKEELEAGDIKIKSWTTASGRRIGGKPSSRGALYLMLQNRLYRGEIVHKGQSHSGEHTPIIDQPLWDAVQAQLGVNTAERSSGTCTRPQSLLAGMLFDDAGNGMTPSYAGKLGTRYRYYVSRPLITKDQREKPTGLRIPAGEIEQVVTGRMRQWLVDPGSVYQAIRPFADPSTQRRPIARAEEIGRSWPDLSAARQRTLLATLIERIDIGANRVDIHFRPTRLSALLDITATPSPSDTDGQTQKLSVPMAVRRSGREIKMLIEGTDPFAIAKPDTRLIKLLIRARRFNAALVDSDGVPFAALVQQAGVSPSYFTRLVRLSYLAPDIILAVLDGRQPRDLTADKLLAHSRLPLTWHEQRTVLSFA